MNKGLLENASRNVDSLRKKVDEMNTRDIEKLKDEYNKLVKVIYFYKFSYTNRD